MESLWPELITFGGSLTVAVIGGFVAWYTSRRNLDGEIKKIREQIQAQEAAKERVAIADLRLRYLSPLRYYASTLSKRLGELEAKFQSGENDEVRNWFKVIKDHVTGDSRRNDFANWCYYEGIFSGTTIYYTCSYFYFANVFRSNRPLGISRPVYSEQLEDHLARVSDSFVWGRADEMGVWQPSQEVIGELFRLHDVKITYAQMCAEFTAAADAKDRSRGAPFLRLLDFYWRDLPPANVDDIRFSLDGLVAFIDSRDPQTEGSGIVRA